MNAYNNNMVITVAMLIITVIHELRLSKSEPPRSISIEYFPSFTEIDSVVCIIRGRLQITLLTFSVIFTLRGEG